MSTSPDDWSPADDLAFRIEVAGSRHPLRAATKFIAALALADPIDTGALEAIVTPESRATWGDFTAVRRLIDGIEAPGFASHIPRSTPEDADVAQVFIVTGVTAVTNLEPGDYVDATAVMTLVWRPEVDSWLVHAVGAPVAPDQLGHARTAPGSAPDWRSA